MINGILFSIIVMLLVYILLKYFGVWIGCTTSLVVIIALFCIPILSFLLLTGVFLELLNLIFNIFMKIFT